MIINKLQYVGVISILAAGCGPAPEAEQLENGAENGTEGRTEQAFAEDTCATALSAGTLSSSNKYGLTSNETYSTNGCGKAYVVLAKETPAEGLHYTSFGAFWAQSPTTSYECETSIVGLDIWRTPTVEFPGRGTPAWEHVYNQVRPGQWRTRTDSNGNVVGSCVLLIQGETPVPTSAFYTYKIDATARRRNGSTAAVRILLLTFQN